MATLKDKIGYGLGDMSAGMLWKILSMYLPMFYGVAFGLDLVTIGTLIVVSRFWDAVSDPIMGLISDRTWSRKGRFRPYMLWFSVPLAISTCMMFTTPDYDTTGRTIWAYITYMLMMMFYTIINVPYSAMLGVITTDSHEKTLFAVFRMAFAYAGGFLVVLLWKPLSESLGGYTGPGAAQGWRNGMIVVSAVCVVLFLLCFANTREVVKTAPPKSVKDDLKGLTKNIPWCVLTVAAFTLNMFNTFRGTAMMFYFQYYLGGLGSTLITAGLFMAAGEISNMLSIIFLTMPLSRKFGKKQLFVYSGIAMAILSAAFYWVPSSETGLIMAFVLQILLGVITGLIAPLIWSMYADVSDYAQVKNDSPSVGLVFSTGSMAQKLGGAIASSLVLWLLAGFGLDTEAETQSSITKLGLKVCMSFYPAGIAIIMAYISTIYPLDSHEMSEVHSKLNQDSAKLKV